MISLEQPDLIGPLASDIMVRSADLPLTVPPHPTSMGPSARDPPYSTPPGTGRVGDGFSTCLVKSQLKSVLSFYLGAQCVYRCLTLSILTLRALRFCVVEGCPVHQRRFSSILGLYSSTIHTWLRTDARSTPELPHRHGANQIFLQTL